MLKIDIHTCGSQGAAPVQNCRGQDNTRKPDKQNKFYNYQLNLYHCTKHKIYFHKLQLAVLSTCERHSLRDYVLTFSWTNSILREGQKQPTRAETLKHNNALTKQFHNGNVAFQRPIIVIGKIRNTCAAYTCAAYTCALTSLHSRARGPGTTALLKDIIWMPDWCQSCNNSELEKSRMRAH